MQQKRGRLDVRETQELLETLVFQQLADTAVQKGMCRIAIVVAASWQADVLRASSEITQVHNAEEMRRAAGNPDVSVIFLPQSAMVTEEIVSRICVENPLDKFVIYEK